MLCASACTERQEKAVKIKSRAPAQPWQLWQPGFADKARAFLVGKSFQSACQLALGAATLA